MRVKYGEIRNVVIYNYIKRKVSQLKRRRQIVSYIAQVTACRKRLLKAKLLSLKELLVRENKPKTKRVRYCRRHLRNTGWQETVNSEYSDERFKQTFRVSRKTFNFLLSKIEHYITKKESRNSYQCKQTSCSVPLQTCEERLLLHNPRNDWYQTIDSHKNCG